MPRKRAETARPATNGRGKGKDPRPAPITWQTARCEATGMGWHFAMPDLLSVNRVWRRGRNKKTGKSVTYKADKAKEATEAAGLKFGRIAPFTGSVGVQIVWVRERRVGDLDNKAKAVLDLLKGIAFVDDQQVERITMERTDDPTRAPGLYVDVWETKNVREAA